MTTWRSVFWLAVVAATLAALWAWRVAYPGPRRLDHAILVLAETLPRPAP